MAKPLFYNARIVAREDHTDQLCTFRIQYDEPLAGDGPAFVPGQYVALGMNNEVEPDKGAVRRSMSIASAPEHRDGFDFYIRYVGHPESDNPLTHLLWRAKVDDRVFMTRKPVGKFTLRDTCGKDDPRIVLMIAAGTGLAPFVSMIRSWHHRDDTADMSRWVLLHGASYPADLCYGDELAGYVEQHNLHYLRTVSRPQQAAGWTGDTGRVEDYLLPEHLAQLEQRIGLGAGELRYDKVAVLICGLQGTIAQTIVRLAPRGFVPFDRKIRRAFAIDPDVAANVWWEQYDTSPVIDVDDAALIERLKAEIAAAR